MSTPSGIAADQKLLATLSETLHDNKNDVDENRNGKEIVSDNIVAVVANISEDSTSVKFNSIIRSLKDLHSILSTHPLYLFVKQLSGKKIVPSTSNSDSYTFVSYVPDTASVRERILYASTKGALLTQLGPTLISTQSFISDPDDLDHVLNSPNESASNKSSLTEHEKIEREIASTQRKMKHDLNLGSNPQKLVSQTNNGSNPLSFKVDMSSASSSAPIKEILNSNNAISFQIDIPSEKVHVVKESNYSTPNDLIVDLSDPSYTIYKNDGSYYFIYCCPSGSKVRDRMIYASNKLGFIKYLKDIENLEFDNTLELGDFDEIDLSLISKNDSSDENTNSNSSTKKFERPKGPMRRKKL